MAWNMHLLWTYILNTFHCCYRALLKALCLLSTAEIDWNIPCLSLIWFDGQFHYDLSQSLVYAYVCVFACVCVCVCVCVLLTYHLLTQAVVNRMMYLRCKVFTQVRRFCYGRFLQKAFLTYHFEYKSTLWPIMPSDSGDDYLVITLMNIFNATTHWSHVRAIAYYTILEYSIKLIRAVNWIPIDILYKVDDSIVKNMKTYSLCLLVFSSCAFRVFCLIEASP